MMSRNSEPERLLRSLDDALEAAGCSSLLELEHWLGSMTDSDGELSLSADEQGLTIELMNDPDTIAFPFRLRDLVDLAQREADDRWSQREDEYFDDFDLW